MDGSREKLQIQIRLVFHFSQNPQRIARVRKYSKSAYRLLGAST
jgi:hypothetical protein